MLKLRYESLLRRGLATLGMSMLMSPILSQVICIGHRGGRGLAPENTLAAVRAGLASGVPILEIDVHQSADSVVVVHHDETLDRCTDGHGRIDATRWEEIAKLDAGSWFGPAYKGERVARLEDVLQVVNGKCRLWIELKAGGDYPGIEHRIVELIHSHHAEDWADVISFDGDALKKIDVLDSNIRIHKLMVSNLTLLPWYLDTGLRLGNPLSLDYVDGYIYHHRFVRRAMVKRFHSRGLPIYVWTVNKPKRFARMSKIGVDGIETDYPGKLK